MWAMIADMKKEVRSLIKLNQWKRHYIGIKKVWKGKSLNKRSIKGKETFCYLFCMSLMYCLIHLTLPFVFLITFLIV